MNAVAIGALVTGQMVAVWNGKHQGAMATVGAEVQDLWH